MEPISLSLALTLDFDPTKEKLEKAVSRHRKTFDRALWEFEYRCLEATGSPGIESYYGRRGVNRDHFFWLAIRQVRGFGYTRTANLVTATPAAVRKGVARAAEHLGLSVTDLRKARRGRPLGSKDKSPRRRASR